MAGTARRFAFTQFDVFTSRPLEGTQLAVVHDATGLNDAEMQAIAREMNLSETTFIFPRDAATERERASAYASSPSRRNCPSPDIPRSAPHSFFAATLARARSDST